MAEISSTILSGSILLPTTENTSSAGNIWFDGTNVKYSTLEPGAWSAGGAMITARHNGAGTGQQNAALYTTGKNPTFVTCTEEYNGSTWSAGGALATARYGLGASGTQNAGVVLGIHQILLLHFVYH